MATLILLVHLVIAEHRFIGGYFWAQASAAWEPNDCSLNPIRQQQTGEFLLASTYKVTVIFLLHIAEP